MVSIKAINVSKRFGKVVALDKVSMEVKEGEFFTLLGPSGCGKTTFLRTVAGFEIVDEGRIFFDDRDVTYLPPYKRNTGMVFQNYALWPHMSVYDNIAYGLKIRKLPKDEIRKRVEWALDLIKMRGFENRKPHQLSGGQQQRVALARALVIHPDVLLLDEPLSNLDAKLRIEMRTEIRRLQRSLGITTIYVTHDQEEALSISDRIAVMNQGRVMQIGSPKDIYLKPQNEFVASFIGRGTFLKGEVVEVGRNLLVELDGLGIKVYAKPSKEDARFKIGDKVLITIRPESFNIKESKDSNSFEVKVLHVAFMGGVKRVEAEGDGARFVFDIPRDMEIGIGEKVKIYAPYIYTLAIKI